MRILRFSQIILTAASLSGIIFLSCSCTNSETTSTTTTKLATAQTGSITNTVTGTGNLELAKTEDLAFEMDGYVESILVEESESVTAGQELATVNTADWEDNIKTLEKALTTAHDTLKTKQEALTDAERTVTECEADLKQEELDLETAEYNLSEIDDVKEAQDEVDEAQRVLDAAEAAYDQGDGSITEDYLKKLQTKLDTAQDALDSILEGTDTTLTDAVKLQIATDTLAVEQAKKAVTDAQLAIEDAQTDVADAQDAVTEADQDVTDAQANLDEENALNPVITAPFDGFITQINVAGGDEVYKGTVAMQIADPDSFYADILVTETDIFSIELGQTAEVTVDALSDLTFPATITAIAPLSTTSSGVVNYEIEAELDPLTDQNATLKDGLSAVVTITIEQKEDVLIVPSRAITTKNSISTVEVVNGTTTETRTIETGISDSTNTEITSGLKAGEQVMVKSSTSSTSTTEENEQGGGGFSIGGLFR